ncbi:hypothetical protein HispidOSU_027712 [Sigmodon hispidus]
MNDKANGSSGTGNEGRGHGERPLSSPSPFTDGPHARVTPCKRRDKAAVTGSQRNVSIRKLPFKAFFPCVSEQSICCGAECTVKVNANQNIMDEESFLTRLKGKTHLEKIHVLQSQSLDIAMVLSTDNRCYLNMDDIMVKVHDQCEEIPTLQLLEGLPNQGRGYEDH